MANNPITDTALEELDRLHAAAPPTPYYYGHNPNDQDRWNNEMWSNAKPNPSFFLVNVDHPKSGEVMAFVATLCNAYPTLRQRLLDAESRLADVENALARAHSIAARQLAEPADIGDSIALVRICTEIEEAKRLREGGE